MRFIKHITKPNALSAVAGSPCPMAQRPACKQISRTMCRVTALVMDTADFGFLKDLVVGSHRKPFPKGPHAATPPVRTTFSKSGNEPFTCSAWPMQVAEGSLTQLGTPHQAPVPEGSLLRQSWIGLQHSCNK